MLGPEATLQRAVLEVPGMDSEDGLKVSENARLNRRSPDTANIDMALNRLKDLGLVEKVPGSKPTRWRWAAPFRTESAWEGPGGGTNDSTSSVVGIPHFMSGSRRPWSDPDLEAEVTVEVFVDNDSSYEAWLRANPAGYVLNTYRAPSASYLKLHRATCGTISGAPARGSTWTKDYIKTCSPVVAELAGLARTSTGGELDPCGFCHPRT